MTVTRNLQGEKLILKVSGRVDTITAPNLEKELEGIDGAKDVVFDFDETEYVSSAGLRVILKAQKMMAQIGSFKVINVSEEVYEVFDITGFADVIAIEQK